MRFAAIASVVILVLAAADATSAKTPKRASLTGTVKVLKQKRITVHGSKRNLTCRITQASPDVRRRGFKLGRKVRITCKQGVLTTIRRPITKSTKPVTPSGSSTTPKETAPAPEEPGTGGVKVAPSIDGTATITAIGGGAIEFGSISCLLDKASPSLAGFRVGSRVSYSCDRGYLTAIGAGEGT